MTSTARIAADLIAYRRSNIEDAQDVAWYAHEMHGEAGGAFDVDAVIATVNAQLGF